MDHVRVAGALLQRLWYDRPVRTQLLVAVGAINLLAAVAGGAVSILNTRTATRVEIEASLEVAQRFVGATIKDLATQGELDQLDQQLPLQLKHLRHVRILIMDTMGQLTVVSPQRDENAAATRTAPAWFAALVRPQLVGRAVRVVAADEGNPVVIVGEPADEIAEAWQDFYSLALVWLLLDALILAVLFVVLGRVLDPLANLSRGMLNLEDGHYATRLKAPKVKELAVITNRFNTLASALDTARDENSRLYQQLISVQEEERREIANELHDEAGPCLFGITANASSVKNLADQVADGPHAEISRRVGEILSIAERLKLMNRALIKKLRPGSLGRVGLAELLDELVAGFERRHPDTEIIQSIQTLASSYGEEIDLTLYRCVQEAITNAIRHGKAGTITMDLVEDLGPRGQGRKPQANTIRLSISDDGKGMAKGTLKGFGLSTMIERVRSLGGSCAIDGAPSKGTTIRIEIPVEGRTAPRAPPRADRSAVVTRALVIDDHPIVLQGCRQLLEDAGVEHIVQAQSLADGFRLYRMQRPDVIIVDLAMRTGALGGLSFIRRLRLHDQRTPILVFTMHSDPVIVSRALEMGATGYVLKDTSPEEVLKAFQRVRDGRPYLSHDLASEVAFMEARGTTNPLKRMTVRELQTLALVAEGKPYGVIAEHLHVSYKTVANTCTQLKGKLGVRTLPELMRIAIQHLPATPARGPKGEWS